MNVVNETGLKVGWVIGQVPPHRLSATLIVKGTFALRPGEPAVALAEEEQEDLTGDVLRGDDPPGSVRYSTDFALLKPHVDVILTGTCRPPGGRPTPACPVTFEVGSWRKTLAVIGPRIWQPGMLGRRMSEPAPFDSMPLVYENSFGGPGFARNPVGKGVAEVSIAEAGSTHPLPNVEDPERLITSLRDRPAPAGFGAYPMTWPQRMSKAGTYDKAWLENRWPWFPDDFDWAFFNAAPPDQQLRRDLRGDESLRFVNLHPEVGTYESALPGIRVRWLVHEIVGREGRVVEVPLRLDTLQVDMDAQRAFVVWRGAIEARSKKLDEVLDFVILAEPLGDPPIPAIEHWRRIERSRAAPPPMESEPEPEAAETRSEPPPAPSLEWVKELEQSASELEEDARKLVEEIRAQQEAIRAELAERGFSLEGLPELPLKSYSLSPYQAAVAGFQKLAEADPELAGRLGPPKPEDFNPGPPQVIAATMPELPEPKEPWTRERVAEQAARGESLAAEDLAELDLSGLDLSGLDIEGAVLRKANLSGCLLRGTKLRLANLSGADLSRSSLVGADLTAADLSAANLEEADLADAVLDLADGSGARLVSARLKGAHATEAILTGADLSSARLEGACLDLADLDEAVLGGADLTGASLRSTSLEKAGGEQVLLRGTDLSGAKAAGASFPGGLFNDTKAPGSVWEGAKLDAADFSGSELSRASFEGASLRGTILRHCDLRHARFPETVLDGADLRESNLFRGTLEGARLDATDFRGSNLYEVEFYEAHGEGARFEGANLKGTKLS